MVKRNLIVHAAVAVVFVGGMLNAAFGEAIVTLKSGEVLRGDVVSDTNGVLQIRAFNANRTISSLRNLPRSDVQNVQAETPAEAAERINYFALSKFQSDPDQERSAVFYAQRIDSLEKFLKDYPDSDKSTIVRQSVESCRSDLKHVEAGEVRFHDRWMSPVEKKPLVLAMKLAELQSQHDATAKDIAKLQKQIVDGETQLDAHPSTTPYSQRPMAKVIAVYQQQLSTSQLNVNGLNRDIQNVKDEILQAQQAYEATLPKANREDNPPTTPSPALPISTPTSLPITVTPSWIDKNGKGFAIGIGILVLLLLALAYPFKLLMRKMGQAQAQREDQRRAARQNLKKLFDKIFAEGERPTGPNIPEGKIIPIGQGEDSYGGGRWFIIGIEHIWAVQNNGGDRDNWTYNNVTTKGRGAVGARISMDSEWADAINAGANAAK